MARAQRAGIAVRGAAHEDIAIEQPLQREGTPLSDQHIGKVIRALRHQDLGDHERGHRAPNHASWTRTRTRSLTELLQMI